jgi:hypothetical protein
MAYMNQTKKATIAEKVKPILVKYGVKGTLSVRNHSTIVLTLREGKIDFVSDMVLDRPRLLANGITIERDALRTQGIDVNPYWYHEHYTGTALAFLSEIFPALKGANWYDNSDVQSDYFDTAYYVDVNVGTWDKPYKVTA